MPRIDEMEDAGDRVVAGEVRIGDPVVHEQHGIGRYLGLVLFAAQQFRSQVHRRVVGNSGTALAALFAADAILPLIVEPVILVMQAAVPAAMF